MPTKIGESFTVQTVGIFILLTTLSFFYLLHVLNRKHSVPGPKGLPIFGNALDLVRDPQMIPIFKKRAAKYGSVFKFTVLGQTHVVLSDDSIVHELFSKRGDIYSDRGTPTAINIYTKGVNSAMLPKNELWRNQRKLMHSIISSTGNVRYEPFIDIESKYTLRDLLNTPRNFDDHLGRYTYGVVTRAGIGKHVRSIHDPYVQTVEKMNDFAVACFRPDKWYCNLAPWILKLPSWLSSEATVLYTARDDLSDWSKADHEALQARINAGSAPECTQKYFLENQSSFGLAPDEGGGVFTAFLGAGTRSPHNALLGFLELDRVVGSNRLPQFSDIPSLSTLRAVVKEVIRYRAVHAEPGIPHKLRTDDLFNDMYFKAGTVFHANYSTILSEPEMYPDGDTYNPARWVEPKYPTYKEPLTQYPNLTGFQAFGVGRRACPGVDFAERTVTIMCGRIAWAFNITQANSKFESGVEEGENLFKAE